MAEELKTNYFSIVSIGGGSDWEIVYRECSSFFSKSDYCALREYLCGHVKSVIIEKKYHDKDYRDTYYNFYSKKFANYPSLSMRLHFFSKYVHSDDFYNLDKYQEEYIGYSVLRPTRCNTIGRTVLDPHKISKSGTMCLTEYRVNLLGRSLKVLGFPYISQDTDVTICAHASIWMAARYLSEKIGGYAEVLPFQITQKTKNLSYGRLVPSRGLTIPQVAEIFSNLGFFPEVYSKKKSEGDFLRLLYYYVEPGIPVVAGLEGEDHAVTVFGHYSDYEKEHAIEDSYGYVDAFVINDDNCLPYQLMYKDGFAGVKNNSSKYKIEDIDSFVVPLYEKMYLVGEYVEELVDSVIDSDELGIKKNSPLLFGENIVKRIFLTTSKSYKEKCSQSGVPFDLDKVYVEMPMPKFIWVCELSLKDLYRNKMVVGEIILDATATRNDMFAFMSIHYPEFFCVNDRECFSDTPDRFVVLAELNTDEIISYKMYENNLEELCV